MTVAAADRRSFIPLFVTNLFGTMNDNFLKTLASFVVIGWISDPETKSVFMGVTAGALVLPYVLLSPLADRLTVVFSKRRVLQLCKWAELPIVAIGIAGFAFHSVCLVVAAVLLMGVQSSLYSPSKYALVRDIGGEDRLSTGMGGMEGVAFLGVLAGTIAASLIVDACAPVVRYATLMGLAVAGVVGSHTIRAEEVRSRALHAINPIRYLCRAYRLAKGYPGLNAVVFTLSAFWWAAAMLQMGLLVYGREVMKLDSAQTGMMLAAAAVGIVVGQVVAGLVDRRHPLLCLTPVTGLAAAALLGVLAFVPLSPAAFSAVLGLLAVDLGFFKLPLDVEIQRVVKGPRLNTILAYFNQVSFLFMLLASGCYALVGWLFGPRAFLLLLAGSFVVVPVLFALNYRSVLMSVGRWILFRRYAVTVDGLEALGPAASDTPTVRQDIPPVLVLPNHPAMVDPLLVMLTLRRLMPRPLVDELFFRIPVVTMLLRTVGAIEVPDLRAHRTERGARAARGLTTDVLKILDRGGSVLLYPSGHIQTEADREEIGTRQLAYNVCGSLPSGARVLGVRTSGLWGSIWSRCGRKTSPNFPVTLLKGILLWLFAVPFRGRRQVTLHLEDLTDRVRGWSTLTRNEFNRALEEWYGGSAVRRE